MAATPRRAGLLLGAAGLAMFAIDLDFFSLNLALPDMAVALGSTTTDLQWAISAPLLALGALLIPAGRLGDIFGRRPLFLFGAALFAVASLGCGLANSVGLLVGMRVLQGVGGAVLMPLTVAVVASAYGDPKARGRAIGLVYGIGAIGAAAGPFVGGVLTEQLGWEWVFFFNVPIAVGALLLGLAGVENSRDEHAARRVDLAGLVLVASGIVAVSYAFHRAAAWGWGSPKFIGLLGAGIALLVGFVLVEAHVRNPLVDLALFRNRPFVVVTAAGMVANSAFVIAIFATTLYLQQVRGLSPVEAGLVFLAPSVALAFAGPLSGRLAEHLRPERIGALAVVIGAVGLLIQTADIVVWAFFLVGIAVMGLGYGIGWSYASVGTQAVVRPEQAGQASGVTLAFVIGGAGVFLVIAANAIEEISGSKIPTAGAIEDVLRVVAAVSLIVGGVLLVLGGRRRRQVAVSDALIVGFAFVLGAVVGSFLNVVLWRVPRHESIVTPPSHCPECGTPLSARDLIPVVSWVALRGRCRTCHTSISIRYPLIELGTGLAFAVVAVVLS